MATLNLVSFVVRNEDGSVNVEKTEAKFSNHLADWITQTTLEREAIENTVHAIFDEFKGATVQKPALVHGVLRLLNCQPGNYKTMKERVEKVVNDMTGDEDGNPLGMKKGQKGGFFRKADVTVEEKK